MDKMPPHGTRWWIALLIIAFVLAGGPAAWAARRGQGRKPSNSADAGRLKGQLLQVEGQGKTASAQLSKAQAGLAATRQQVSTAEAALTRAQEAMNDARSQQSQARSKLDQTDQHLLAALMAAAPCLSLQQKVAEAQAAYTARVRAVKAELATDPVYQRAQAAAAAAHNHLQTLQESDQASSSQIASTAIAANDADVAVKQIQDAAVNSDAKAQPLAAALAVAANAYQNQLDLNRQAILKDPKHLAAVKTLADTTAAVQDAARRLADARQTLGNAESHQSGLQTEVAQRQDQVNWAANAKANLNTQIAQQQKQPRGRGGGRGRGRRGK